MISDQRRNFPSEKYLNKASNSLSFSKGSCLPKSSKATTFSQGRKLIYRTTFKERKESYSKAAHGRCLWLLIAALVLS